ncbi:MAG: hypothetical protein OXH00_02720 [Candidatus Poribacteria bacterium]|nr:hypothetical protein [Candidatus Poribacteria bacterium]
MKNVPSPPTQLSLYVYDAKVHPIDKEQWPVLVLARSNALDDLPRDAKHWPAQFEFKYETEDEIYFLLPTRWGSGTWQGADHNLYNIPPKKGTLYWRYYEFCVNHETDEKQDGEWVGGVYFDKVYSASDGHIPRLVLRGNDAPTPYIPIEQAGNPDWRPATMSERAAAWKKEKARFDRLGSEIHPLQDRIAREGYVEDFGDDLWVGGGEPHASAPQWLHDAWKTIKEFHTEQDFLVIAQNIRDRLDGVANKMVAFKDVPYGTQRRISRAQGGYTPIGSSETIYSGEVIADEDEARWVIAWRRAQIRAFRAGEITEINWRAPDRNSVETPVAESDPVIEAVKQIQSQNNPADFTKSGKPKVRPTSQIAGQKVSAKQRDAAWKQVK